MERDVYNISVTNTLPGVYICMKDLSGKFLDINLSMAKMLGMDPEQIRGVHSKDVLSRDWQKYLCDDLKVAKGGEPIMGIIEPFEPDNRDKRLVQTDKYPLRNETGDIFGVLVYCQDITSLVKRESDFYKELNVRKLKFAKMSHDLRVPMSGLPILLNALEQIDLSKLSPENRDYINIARSNANLTYNLMTNILDTYTQEPEDSPLEKFDFLYLVVDIAAAYAEQASKRLVTLRIQNGGSERNMEMSGRMQRVRGVLMKLIGMAIQFFKNSEIWLKFIKAPEKNGVVIDIEVTQNILEFQQHGTGPSEYGIFQSCKAAILEMGGTLTSSSTPNEGKFSCSMFLPSACNFL